MSALRLHKIKRLPDQSYLKTLFDYCPNTGQLFWRVRRSGATKNKPIQSIMNEGYCRVGIDGVRYYLHRIIWKLVHGTDPKQIDHINGNRSDNRIENLRSVSHIENGKNQKRPNRNTSGYAGVSKTKSGKWRARIFCAGKERHLGVFESKKDAIAARVKAKSKYGFHHNHGS